jgi:copper(I)-binding protein
MGKSIRAALALAVVTLVPVACSEAPEQAETAPEAPDGIVVENARLLLPAVAGNPGAVYFDVVNSGDRDRMIRAASVAGAGNSMMHVTHETGMQETLQVMVKAGETVKFEPGGTHVMAMDLADTVAEGGETEVTVTFVGGDKVSFPAKVHAAGDER